MVFEPFPTKIFQQHLNKPHSMRTNIVMNQDNFSLSNPRLSDCITFVPVGCKCSSDSLPSKENVLQRRNFYWHKTDNVHSRRRAAKKRRKVCWMDQHSRCVKAPWVATNVRRWTAYKHSVNAKCKSTLGRLWHRLVLQHSKNVRHMMHLQGTSMCNQTRISAECTTTDGWWGK